MASGGQRDYRGLVKQAKEEAAAAAKPAAKSAGQLLNARIAAAPSSGKAKPKAKPLTLAQAVAPSADERAVKRESGMALGGGLKFNPGGIARAVKNTGEAVVQEVATHPVRSTTKAAGTVKDVVKGVGGAVLGLPDAYVNQTVDKALHGGRSSREDSVGTIASRIVGGEAKRVSSTYGPSYRGDKGARGRLQKQVHKEGPLPAALDLATLAAPISSGLGIAARTAADAGIGGRVVAAAARATRERAPLKINATRDAEAQRIRPSAAGAAASQGLDAARRLATKRAVKRAAKPAAKPLRGDRALLKDGEVAPLTRIGADRKLRIVAATNKARQAAAAAIRVKAQVTGDVGETLRTVRNSVPAELHPVVDVAKKLGIRDSEGARAALPVRIAKVEEDRAAALAKVDKNGKRDHAAEAQAHGAEGELALLRQLENDPSPFDNPAVRAAADAEGRLGRKIKGREGLSEDAAALGRSQNLGHTLGVKTAAEQHAAAKAAHAVELDAAKADAKAAAAARDKVRATSERVLSGARADLAKAKGRAEVLSRNVTGRNTLGAGAAKYAAGAKGVADAEKALARAQSAVEERLGGATGAVNDARVALKQARAAAPKKIAEAPAAYEARVIAANRALHPSLVAPEHVPAGFEREGFRPVANVNGAANPLAKTSHGTLDRLGRSETDYKLLEHDAIAKLSKGAAHEYESSLFRDHGKIFANEKALNTWAKAHGLNADPALGRVDIELVRPTNGVMRKDLAPVRTGKRGLPEKGSDHGDYHATDAVVAMPVAITKELRDLHALSAAGQGKISGALRKAAHYSQAVLLGGSLGWFQFQRVNDVLAAALGGSLLHTHALNKALKGLDEDARQTVHVLSGGSVSSAMLQPNAAMELGRMKQLMDASPVYQKALNSRTPVGALLRANGGQNPLTGLLRADQAITTGVRERQFLHNLSKFAERNDARAGVVNKAFGPIADAFKTGDMASLNRLLRDPANHALLEDAAQQLYKIHGDWHNFTAAERRFGATAAFYGFLRYATRMALFTLPLGSPHMALLLAQLGHMTAEDSKSIIGPDQPWGLGAIYNKDGTVAADLTRGNPLLSPILNIDKPEDLVGLATPLASIVLSYITATPIGLSNSAEGYIRQFTTHGDPATHAVGGFLSPERLRIGLRQLLDLAAPTREWDKFDSQQQSDDSLPWSRRFLSAPESLSKQSDINQKNATAESGLHGLVRRQLPLFAPGSAHNLKVQGASIAAGKQKTADAAELRAAKRQGANTPLGQFKLQLGEAKLERGQGLQDYTSALDQAKRELQLAKARAGG